MAEPKFAFYEKVVVSSTNPKLASIAGQLAAILGRACNDDGTWGYAIWIYDEKVSKVCWCCDESELRPTGEFDRRETFHDGTSVRISQDGELLD